MTNKIDFYVIGAMKSGTTWLYTRLDEIPEFHMLPQKELHYFDRDEQYPSPNLLCQSNPLKRFMNHEWRGKVLSRLKKRFRHKHNLGWFCKYYLGYYDDRWYQSLFERKDGLSGEVCPAYALLNRYDIKRMHKIAPDAKIVFILRNPVRRAWSHLRFGISKGRLASSILKDHDKIKSFFKSERQRLRSDYKSTLSNYSTIYGSENILIGFYDAIEANPKVLINDIASFISSSTNFNYSFCQYDQLTFASKLFSMDKGILEFLTRYYVDEIRFYAESIGSYAENWLWEIENGDMNITSKQHSSTIRLSDSQF